jgi:excisionase family DNA binding protein
MLKSSIAMENHRQEFFTPEQIASLLQVNVVTVRRWLKSGRLGGYHLGRKLWRISRTQLEEFLAFEFDHGTGKVNKE